MEKNIFVASKRGFFCLLAVICLSLSAISASFAGPVLSNTEKHDYLIITSKQFYSSFLVLANYCNNTEKLNTVIYTTEDINTYYSGNDLLVKIRSFIKEAYNSWGIKYVLLGGDTEIIPAFYMLGWCQQHGSMYIPTDMYYSGLDGDWKIVTSGRSKKQEVDMIEELCVGRAPISNKTDAENFVDKTIKYKANSKQWRKNILILGESIVSSLGQAGMADGALNIATTMLKQRNSGYSINKLYDVIIGRGISGWDKRFLRDGGRVPADRHYVGGLNNFDYSLIIHFGHGDRDTIMRQNRPDIPLITNYNPFIVYSLACYSAGFDGWDHGLGYSADRDCASEKLVTSKFGAVAVIGNSRNGLGGTDQVLSGETIDLMYSFVRNINGTRRFGEVLKAAKREIYNSRPHNTGSWEWAIAELNLLGDPTLNFDLAAP